MAIGLANLTALLDPEVIVLGGGLVVAGEVLLEPARRAFEGRLEGAEYRVPTPIVAAQLGEVAGAIGGAALALGASVA